MNYKYKQKMAKLDNWYICHKLGITYNDYIEVKTGKRNLANEKLDIFNDITFKGRKQWLEQESERTKINNWYKTQTSSSLKQLIEEFKVNQTDIAETIGCNCSSVSLVISGKGSSKDIKYLLYYFF